MILDNFIFYRINNKFRCFHWFQIKVVIILSKISMYNREVAKHTIVRYLLILGD